MEYDDCYMCEVLAELNKKCARHTALEIEADEREAERQAAFDEPSEPTTWEWLDDLEWECIDEQPTRRGAVIVWLARLADRVAERVGRLSRRRL